MSSLPIVTFSEGANLDGFVTVLGCMEGYSFQVTMRDGRVYEHLVVKEPHPHDESVEFYTVDESRNENGTIRLRADAMKEVEYL